MKTLLAAMVLVSTTACGTVTSTTASEPVPTEPSSSAEEPRMSIPPAEGTVATRDLATVMDTGKPAGPELCLGAVAESYPPQCSGPPIAGWSWRAQEGVFEKSGDVRWGLFHLTGTWDGETFTVVSSIPAALYSPAAPVDGGPSAGDGGPAGPEVEAVAAELDRDPLPGTLVVIPTADGVLVDVVHDDGSIQAEADRRYGAGAVVVSSALVSLSR